MTIKKLPVFRVTARKPKKEKKRGVGLRRFNVNFPIAEMNAFRAFAKKREMTMAAWAREVLRKAAGLQ